MKEKHKSLLPSANQSYGKGAFTSKDEYEERLLKAQYRLLSLQQHIHQKKKKMIVVFEGPDAAGKGGVIKRFTRYLDPRGVQVHSIGVPNSAEKEQNYFQRFFAKFPESGRISIFDRSWYGRVLVERVDMLAQEKDWKRAYNEINAVEKMLKGDGVLLIKFFLDITYSEQSRRFKERENDPLKSWKLTKDDFKNRKKWDNYHLAFKDMIKHSRSPWHIIAADSKWHARVAVLESVERISRRFFKI